MYSNRPALSNTFRKKINFYAAAIIALPAFDETTWQAKALSPHFLPPSGHRLTTQTGCLMLLQKPESVRENAREWYTNYPATWSHGLQQLRKKLDLFGLKTDSLPPITDTDDTRQGTHAACSVKKTGSSFTLEPVYFLWSGWRDLNARPQRPERCALAKLSHIPLQERTLHRRPAVCKLFFKKIFLRSRLLLFVPASVVPDIAVHVLRISGN